ncbi:TPA: hypothetical protein OPR08_002017 [Citrobacter koseri]|uniref:hypothetical protein n=1 Tax=Citrobacter koseri TaxID=545 RepID=UPI000A8AD3EA|nr:hypothetical protein [Citrobacter koseri]RZA56917.1 hypothetical protein EVX99_22655 [Citrobacter koseri]HCR9749813.1 hypothetical protein [Citrobacter koseri]HCR9769214.1 hypothetical protein [Citrobacter koseri]HEM7948787.1 hypothetical protein [Citrobacter koseri]
MITKNEFKYGFYGNIVTDCAVRNKDLFIFSARDEEGSHEHDLTGEWDVVKYGCMFQKNKDEGKRIGKLTVKGWGRLYCTACTIPLGKFVCISAEGCVYTLGSGENKEEVNISDSWVNKQALPDYQGGGPGYFGVWRAKMLFGHAWVCGPRGNVARRVGEDKWEYRGNPFPDTMDVYELDNQMFMDIDGFSENDMYAVGGPGRVWHYDGQTWSQVAFPTNMHLYAVCCGTDGEVYIGAQSGAVFKGRGSRWRQIAAGGLATPFNDMVWFQDRVWATSDNSIWTITDDSMEQPLIPDEVRVCAGSMSVGDGVLLVAGQGGAAFHNGVLWQSLFLQHEMTQVVDNP